MPRSTKNYVNKDVLINATLPIATKTYTVISHGHIINTTIDLLTQAGFTIEQERYRCNMDARVAQGIYKINYGDDPDLSMMFTWTNSYDKSTRFRCAIGAYVNASGASMVKKTSSWQRKHTGAALQETDNTIKNIIDDADNYFSELIDIKNKMKSINVSDEAEELGSADARYNNVIRRKFGHMLADLAFYKKLLNSDQVSTILKESTTPSYAYTTGANSIWTAYNYILCGVKIAHPKLWLDNQTSVLLHFMDEYDLVTFDEDEDDTLLVNVLDTDNDEATDFSISLPDHTNENVDNSIAEFDSDNTDIEDDIDSSDELFKPITNAIAENNENVVSEEDESSLQNIPADNVVEEHSTEDTMFLMSEDYPDAEVGEYLQINDTIYQIVKKTVMDSVEYLEVIEYIESATEEEEEEIIHEKNEEKVKMSNIFDILNTDSSSEDKEEVEEDNVVVEDVTISKEKDVIKNELIDLYGFPSNYKFDFTFEVKDSQYNITLSTGESIVLSREYIENLL